MFFKTATRVVLSVGILLCLGQNGFAQDWTEPGIEVGDGGAPDVAIDAVNGNVHIVANNNGVYYYKYDSDGNFIRSDLLPNTNGVNYGYNFGSSIATDSEGNPHICYSVNIDRPNDLYDVYYTYHNGEYWEAATKISSSIRRGYHTRIAIDGNDDVHILRSEQVLEFDIVPSEATYIRIKDGQITRTQTGLEYYRPDDHVDIATFGTSDVHLVLGSPSRTGQKVTYYRSDTNGDQLVGPQNILAGHITDRAGGPNIFVDQSGTVHIVYGTLIDSQVGNGPSVRYQRRVNGNIVYDVPVTASGELTAWDGTGIGIGSVAANSNGDIVVVAYQDYSGGPIRTRVSNDGGISWSSSTQIAGGAGGYEGRDKPMIEARNNRFYVVYNNYDVVKLRWFKALGDPPVASAGGPYQKPEGEPVTFDASGSTSGSGAFKEFAWDWDGDGTYDDITANATFVKTFYDNFTANAKLRVTDIDDRTAQATFVLEIINVKPAITINSPNSADEGSELAFEVSISDPGNDTHTVSWNFGDGGSGSGVSVSHAFADEGTYSVAVTVTDDDGGQSTKSKAVTIVNVAPTGDLGGPYTAVKDKSLTLQGSATDPGINDNLTFEWDLNNDGVYERQGAQVSTIYTSLGHFPISMRVTDGDGGTDVVSGEVVVGTGEPFISPIPDQVIVEGAVFAPLLLDNYVTDPDHEDYQLTWSYSGNNQLSVSIINRVASVTLPSPEYFGTEIIQFTATDPTNQSAHIDVRYTVTSVNDAPHITTIPNQTIIEGEVFAQVVLDNFVSDPDHADNTLFWEVSGNSELQVTLLDRVVQVIVPGPDWFGSEVLTFTVRDPLGATDSQQVTYTVTSYNDAPVIRQIPGQTIIENGQFAPISLDQYVSDADNSIDQLTWSVFGNQNLRITIDFNHVATVAVVDSEFAGTENVRFVASDPGNQRDTTTVALTVTGVNDPPVISGFTDKTINEDDSVRYTMAQLAEMIIDPDNSYGELQYTLLGAAHLKVLYTEGKGLSIFGPPNWFGEESVTLKVDDGKAFDTAGMTITVISVPDMPQPFYLLSPNAVFYNPPPTDIAFTWSKTDDPDPGESVTFNFQLASDKDIKNIIHENSTITDTIYNFPASHFLINTHEPQTYYWRVTVTSTDGTVLRSQADASFTILWPTTSVEGFADDFLPEETALLQNYPNPFNPQTTITFDLQQSSEVKLIVYNAIGNHIKTITNEFRNAGRHHFTWDARDTSGQKVASGVYIYRLHAGRQVFTKKMLLLE